MQGISQDDIINGAVTLNAVPTVIGNIVYWLLVFSFLVAVALIIFAGIKFITSGGDEKQVEGARKTLTFAIIGLILVLSSFFIIQFIAKTTGIAGKNTGCLTLFGFETCADKNSRQPGDGPGPRQCPTNKNCGQGWYCATDNTCKPR